MYFYAFNSKKICLSKLPIKSSSLYNFPPMNINEDVLTIIAYVFAGLALLLSIFSNFVFRVPSRSIDYLQWAYLFATIFTATSKPFSSNLKASYSLIQLKSSVKQNFFCDMKVYTCTLPFGLSFAVILVGFLVIMRFITIAEKVQEKGITFHRVYRLFKGLFRWFYLPFSYLALFELITNVQGQKVVAIVMLAICILFPIAQVLLYKFYGEEGQDPMIKYIEFASYAKNFIFAVLLALGPKYSTASPYYYIGLLILSYGVFYGYFYDFKYPIFGRILFATGEVLMYFLYSIYVSDSKEWFQKQYLDLFLLAIILILDIVYMIIEGVYLYRNRTASLFPEDSAKQERHRRSYEELDQSKQALAKSNTSSNKILGVSGIRPQRRRR